MMRNLIIVAVLLALCASVVFAQGGSSVVPGVDFNAPDAVATTPPQGPTGPAGAPGVHGAPGASGRIGHTGPQGLRGESGDYLDLAKGPYRGDPERQKGLLDWFRSIGGITAGEVDEKIENAKIPPAEPVNEMPVNPARKGVLGMDPYVFGLIALVIIGVVVALAARSMRGTQLDDLADALAQGCNRVPGGERMVITGSRNRFTARVEPANATPVIPPAPQVVQQGSMFPALGYGQALVPVQVTANPVVLNPAPAQQQQAPPPATQAPQTVTVNVTGWQPGQPQGGGGQQQTNPPAQGGGGGRGGRGGGTAANPAANPAALAAPAAPAAAAPAAPAAPVATP